MPYTLFSETEHILLIKGLNLKGTPATDIQKLFTIRSKALYCVTDKPWYVYLHEASSFGVAQQ